MAYIVMAYVVMAYTIMAYRSVIVKHESTILVAYIVMAYMVTAYVVMAYTIMAYRSVILKHESTIQACSCAHTHVVPYSAIYPCMAGASVRTCTRRLLPAARRQGTAHCTLCNAQHAARNTHTKHAHAMQLGWVGGREHEATD